jgi:hypothetical protein
LSIESPTIPKFFDHLPCHLRNGRAALRRLETPDASAASGSVLLQSVVLGSIQIAVSVGVNAMIALGAGSIALFLAQRPSWMLLQRYLMGTVLAGLAVRMAFEARKA